MKPASKGRHRALQACIWQTARHGIAQPPPFSAFPEFTGIGQDTAYAVWLAVNAPTTPRLTAASTCEHHVTKASSNRTLGILLLPALLLTACGTPAARDFGGRWKPVNRFQSSTTEIPLNRPYTYYAAPMDETLRTMLVRWTTDTGMTLVYHLASDYTLFAPVTKVRTTNIQQAASELSAVYAAQGVSVTVANGTLRVDRATTLGSGMAPAGVQPSTRTSRMTTKSTSLGTTSGVR